MQKPHGRTDIKQYSIEKVAEHIGLDVDTMKMLLDEFIDVMDEEVAHLEKAVDSGDAEMIKHYAHKMKGASANMMVEDMRHFCSELQNADKSDKALVADLLDNIRKSYAEFRGLFRQS